MSEQVIYPNTDSNNKYRIWSSHADWTTARNGSVLSALADFILETRFTVTYHIGRSFLSFDIPDFSPEAPKSAVLKLKFYSVEEMEVAKPNGIITKGFHGNPLVTGDWTAQTDETVNYGQADMSGWSGGWCDIPFNASGLTLIQNAYGGTLKLCLRCQRDVENSSPITGGIRIIFGTPSEGANRPYLVLDLGIGGSRAYVIP